MAATILPIRTGSPEPCRATGPRTWPRITSSAIRRRAMPSGAASPSASVSPKSCARSCRRRCATCSMACARLPKLCLARTSARRPEREAPERKVAEDPEAALRQARTKALVRHARAVDAIFDMQERGGKASPEQVKELQEARKVFEEVRPYGSHDAEAAYKKNPELVREAAGGQVNRAIRALQLETELRTDPSRRADRFVERWQKLDHTSQRQYQAGDIVRLQGDALGDGRHGEKPRTRSATGIHPRQPQAGSRHRVRIRPPARPGIGLHPRHRPWQRPGHRNLTHPIYRRLFATVR